MGLGVAYVERPWPRLRAPISLGGLDGARRVEVGDEDGVASPGQAPRDLASEAAAAARYDGDAAPLSCARAHGLSALTISRGRGPSVL